MSNPNTQCSAFKKDGSPCGFPRPSGTQFCFVHDPALVEARRDAQAKGGKGKSKEIQIDAQDAGSTDVTFRSQQDVKGYLLKVLEELASRPVTDGKSIDLVVKLAKLTFDNPSDDQPEVKNADLIEQFKVQFRDEFAGILNDVVSCKRVYDLLQLKRFASIYIPEGALVDD